MDEPAPPPVAGTARVRAVLLVVRENHALGRLLSAFLVMTVVEYGEWITILVYAYNHGGASTAGLVALAQLLPSIVLAPMIGAQAARMGAARLLVVCYLTSTLMLGGCAAAILLDGPPIAVYAAAVGFTLPLGISIPLHNVLTPLVVRHPDELTAAQRRDRVVQRSGRARRAAARRSDDRRQGPGAACAVLAGLGGVHAPAGPRAPHACEAARATAQEEGGLRDLIVAARVVAARPNTRALMAYRAGSASIEGAIDLLVVLHRRRILAIGPAAAGYLSSASAPAA